MARNAKLFTNKRTLATLRYVSRCVHSSQTQRIDNLLYIHSFGNSNATGPMDLHALDLLAKSVKFMSCGKLKRASELISQASRIATSEHEHIIECCRELGLTVQTRKYLSKADTLLAAADLGPAHDKYVAISGRGVAQELLFQLLHNRAVCLGRAGRYMEAVCYFQEALLQNPFHPAGLQNAAFSFMAAGEYELALQYFSEVIRLDRVDPKSLLHVLCCAAICRQQLHISSEEHSEAVLAQMGAEQGLLRLHSDPPLTVQSPNVHRNIGHAVSYNHRDTSPLRVATDDEHGGLPVKNHIPFRRFRYAGLREEIPEPSQTSQNDDSKPHSDPVTAPTAVTVRFPAATRYTGAVIGSPIASNHHSRVTRGVLLEAATTFSKAIALENANCSEEEATSLATAVAQRAQAAVSTEVPNMMPAADPTIHVSSTKPKLSGYRGSSARARSPPATAPEQGSRPHLSSAYEGQGGKPTPDQHEECRSTHTPALSKPLRAKRLSDELQPANSHLGTSDPTAKAPVGIESRPALVYARAEPQPYELPVTVQSATAAPPEEATSDKAAAVSNPPIMLTEPQRRSERLIDPVQVTSDPLPLDVPLLAARKAPAGHVVITAHSSANSSLTGDTDYDAPIRRPPSAHRRSSTQLLTSSEPSWQQQEVNRALEFRQHVNQYTVTHADVDKLRTQDSSPSVATQEPQQFYPYAALKCPGPFPEDVDVRHRECYLTAEEFSRVLRVDKGDWAALPAWRRRALKQAHGLF
jgi:tetratricopeptide (TPR) repeat protein